MIPFSFANQLVDLLSGQTQPRPELNEDYAFLAAQNTPQHTAWYLLPAALIRSLQARLAARRYEKSLVDLWSISPHLLEDIGVFLGEHDDRLDHLVAAPPRVVAHIRAQGGLIAEKAPVAEVWTPSPAKGQEVAALVQAAAEPAPSHARPEPSPSVLIAA